MGVPVPNHELKILDGGLSVVPSSVDGVSCKLGTSSLGVAGAIYLFKGADTQRVYDTLGEGDLPDSVAKNLIESDGKDTYALKVAPATPGVSSAITRSLGTAGPTLTVSGAPFRFNQMIVEIVQGGERGVATFRYSTDGGDTWSDEIVTAPTYLLPSGVTIAFPASTATISGSPSDVDITTTTVARNTGSFLTEGFHAGMTLSFPAGAPLNVASVPVLTGAVALTLTAAGGGMVNEPNLNAPTIVGTQPYVAGERHSWTDTGPIMSSGNIGTAIDALIDSVYDPEFVHVVGQAASIGAAHTIATLLATKVEAAWGVHKYMWAAFECPAATRAAIAAEFASFESFGVVGFGGFAEVINDKTSAVEKVSSGRVLSARIARNPIEVHVLRGSGDDDLDSISSVFSILPDGSVDGDGYHDEERTPGLNAARFSTLRTIIGRPGYYPTNALTFGGPASDFQSLPYLRIILKVCRVWYQFGLSQLAKRLRTDKKTGFILPSIAASIEGKGEKQIRAALGSAIEFVTAQIHRDDPLLQDPTVRADVRIGVGPYILALNSQVGLTPSIAA